MAKEVEEVLKKGKIRHSKVDKYLYLVLNMLIHMQIIKLTERKAMEKIMQKLAVHSSRGSTLDSGLCDTGFKSLGAHIFCAWDEDVC